MSSPSLSLIMSSPFAYLFVSNEVPTETEALLIRDALEGYQSQLTHIRALLRDQTSILSAFVPKLENDSLWKKFKRRQISFRRRQESSRTLRDASTSADLLRDHDRIHHLYLSHRVLLSPVRRVPPELWSEIFALCIPDQPFVTPSPTLAPLLLGQVCRAWRHIAVSTPMLWSSLSLSIFRRGATWAGRSLTPANALLATTWLSRSQRCPLSLEISWYPVASSMDSLLDIILSHFSRLRHLRLYVPGESLGRMLNNPDVPLPLLQSLELVTHTVLSDTTRYTVSRTATALRSLVIPTIYVNPLSLDVPWSQLTFLRSHYCLSTRDTLELISRCTNLSDCVLRINWRSDSIPVAPQILLSNLCTISITSESCLQFIDHLTLPSLQGITIMVVRCPGMQPPGWLMSSLLRMVTRSSCPLKTLKIWDSSIHDDPLYEEVILNFLQAVPSVTKVEAVFNGHNQVKGRVIDILRGRQRQASECLL